MTILNGIVFLIYGFLCLFTDHMKIEFNRYGLIKFRLLVGYLEILGGLGVIVGFFVSKILFIVSTLGLALLMFLGVIVRVRVKDPLGHLAPALGLFILNSYLFLRLILF